MKINIKTNLYKQAVRKGFTLIELLVVIAIIAVLASISYGPLLSFMNKGKVTQVKKVCNDIKISVEAFKQDYTYLPYTGTHPDDDSNFVTDTPAGVQFLKVLMGQDDTVNDKEIAYFSAKVAKGSKNGLVEEAGGNITALNDHWGNPYTIRLDYDGDGRLDKNQLNSIFNGFENQEAIIATPSRDGDWGEEDITSW